MLTCVLFALSLSAATGPSEGFCRRSAKLEDVAWLTRTTTGVVLAA